MKSTFNSILQICSYVKHCPALMRAILVAPSIWKM